MSVTPFIRPVRLQGGTFYTFSSSSEDLGFSFNNDDKKFRFSNYVLLNIPDIRTATSNQNNIQFDAVPGAFSMNGSKSLNAYLSESFQNYALNLETLITSSDEYDPDEDRSVSERVLFKWLKEIGAIRFREANNSELSDPVHGVHYVEEDESEIYKRVVQYIGEIDVLNNVRNKDNAYTEVYIHIPTSHGRQPSILFTSIEDSNYYVNAEFTNNPDDPISKPYIVGRKPTDAHPAGLDFQAHYDSELSIYGAEDPSTPTPAKFHSWDASNSTWVDSADPAFNWWYPTPKADTYFLERNYFTDPTNDKFKIEGSNKIIEYVRSRLDGISLEFNENAYKDIQTNTDINSFGELAESGLSESFEFNTVLVYYELFDPQDSTKSVRNLFGVLFLDNVDPKTGGGGEIPRLEKFKPNALTGDSGNAYSFKINLKFDVSAEDAAVETTVNDYNTFSLDLYVDALNELRETTRLFRNINDKLEDIKELSNDTRGLVLDNPTATELIQRVESLETLLANNGTIDASATQILSLVERNYKEINNIYKGKTSVEIAYNLDAIKQGPGVKVDRSSNESTVISSDKQEYSLGTKPRVGIITDFTIEPEFYHYTTRLLNFSNYMKVVDGSPDHPLILDRDIILYIDDTKNGWSAGQVFRIYFEHGLDMDNTNGQFDLNIYTDAGDLLDTGFVYNALVGIVSWDKFNSVNRPPIVEIVCINPKTFDFDINIL